VGALGLDLIWQHGIAFVPPVLQYAAACERALSHSADKKGERTRRMLQHGWHTAAFFHVQFSFKREMDRTTEERAVILACILQEMQNQNNKKNRIR
jgi:hypothetical protein